MDQEGWDNCRRVGYVCRSGRGHRCSRAGFRINLAECGDLLMHGVAIQTLEQRRSFVEREIKQTQEEIDTLHQSYQDATEHLDSLFEKKDSLTASIRVLRW